jgi:hypothetical protein
MADVIYFGEGIALPCCANDNENTAYFYLSSTTSPLNLSEGISDNFINQGGTQSSFTFKLPPLPIDGQIVTLTFNNAVTTLTIDGNGHSIVGSNPTSASVGNRFSFKYYEKISSWFRIV